MLPFFNISLVSFLYLFFIDFEFFLDIFDFFL